MKQQVLDHIRAHPGWDDDALALELGVSPRQTINALCRQLASDNLIRRVKAPGAKILNYPSEAGPEEVPSRATMLPAEPDQDDTAISLGERSLKTKTLLQHGFEHVSSWRLGEEGALTHDRPLPTQPGVYAFAIADMVYYVGVATMGLKKRLRFYERPGPTQSTSIRLKQLLTSELASGATIDILTAHPPELTWMGLPVNGNVGLELGLIQNYVLPWNIRGKR